MKICLKCKVEKPVSEFYRKFREKDGRQTWCKNCRKTHQKPYKRSAKTQDRQLRSLYGMSLTEKLERIAAQGGRCAICGDKFLSSRNTHVDHLHGSYPAIIRGILCSQCNTALGLLKDCPKRISSALTYITSFLK